MLENFDLVIPAADMASDNQNNHEHLCNHNVVLDRVTPVGDLLQ